MGNFPYWCLEVVNEVKELVLLINRTSGGHSAEENWRVSLCEFSVWSATWRERTRMSWWNAWVGLSEITNLLQVWVKWKSVQWEALVSIRRRGPGNLRDAHPSKFQRNFHRLRSPLSLSSTSRCRFPRIPTNTKSKHRNRCTWSRCMVFYDADTKWTLAWVLRPTSP